MSASDPHTFAGAYALDALDDDERDTFEAHLATCAECRQEVAEFVSTAGRLALAVGSAPPPALKHSVLRQISRVRQEPPRVVRESTVVQAPQGSPQGSLWLRRLALAACLVAASLGGVATWQHQEARQAREQAHRAEASADQVAEVLAAGDARTHTASLPGGARGVVVTSASQNRAVFSVSGLDAPPEGKVYELWFNDDGTMRPAGLLDRDQSTQITLMDGTIDQADGMGITIEPSGGSKTPTLPPVGLIEFPA
ncbi:anti-sigma factor [Streptomyces sp. WAC 01529]|uniref:anti-sigma factor n=1 Tax=Streptomyces sp. WAC 01529 TaxID=2203205 RepID=UPI000F6C22AC|nr:anti-sigma factor [Streptomyces sp. WAC 01529]AZM51281.1 anti-sigma factor [Streptomyces sp. WAC 01529]